MTWPLQFFAALPLGLALAHVDVLMAVRDEDWGGWQRGDTRGLAIALAAYCLLTLLLSLPFGLLANRMKRRSDLIGLASVMAGAWATWTVVALLGRALSTPYLVLGYGACCAAAVLLALAPRLARVTPLQASLVTGGIALWMLLCHLHAATVLLAHPSRRMPALFLTVALGAALVVVCAACLRCRGGKQAVSVLLCAAIATAPSLDGLLWPLLAQRARGKHANLLLLTADALRADVCAPFAPGAETPAIGALAERGVWFTRGYSCAPWTVPSLVGLMSSQHAAQVKEAIPQTGPHDPPQTVWYDPLPPHATLAEALRDEGYSTAAFLGNPLLGGLRATNDGFDTARYFNMRAPDRQGPFHQCPAFLGLLSHLGLQPRVCPVNLTERLCLLGESFLRTRALAGGPFFLWIHFGDPHDPYTPPPTFCRDPVLAEQMRNLSLDTWPPTPTSERRTEGAAEPERTRLKALYLGEVRYFDYAVGQLLSDAESLGLFNNTVICLSSDHGEEFWEHGFWGHGCTVYEAGIRVPLTVCGPTVQKRGAQDIVVTGRDLAPTFAGLLGVAAPDAWEGRDLAPWLRGGAPPQPAPQFIHGTLPFAGTLPQRAAIDNSLKLIETLLEDGSRPHELHDLAKDPEEGQDISQYHPELTEDLLRFLGASARQAPVPPAVMDEDKSRQVNDQLRALGYL